MFHQGDLPWITHVDIRVPRVVNVEDDDDISGNHEGQTAQSLGLPFCSSNKIRNIIRIIKY